MKTSKKVLIIIIILGFGIFGYSQYASASNIGVIVTENEFLEKSELGSTYSVKLEFNNPSLLILNAGQTDFIITVENMKIADGVLDSFVLPSMSKTTVNGIYFKDENSQVEDSKSSNVKISGITKYNLFFASLEVPFVYIPSEEQARGFIQQI